MVEPIFISPYFLDFILPFALVFVLIFAILERSKILGEDKRKVNVMISLVIGLILIASPLKVIIVKLMPFMAVCAVVLFVFMLLYGFAKGTNDGNILNKGLVITFGILIAIALITALLIFTGAWDTVYNFVFSQETGPSVLVNVILLVVIAGAVVAVLIGGKKE